MQSQNSQFVKCNRYNIYRTYSRFYASYQRSDISLRCISCHFALLYKFTLLSMQMPYHHIRSVKDKAFSVPYAIFCVVVCKKCVSLRQVLPFIIHDFIAVLSLHISYSYSLYQCEMHHKIYIITVFFVDIQTCKVISSCLYKIIFATIFVPPFGNHISNVDRFGINWLSVQFVMSIERICSKSKGIHTSMHPHHTHTDVGKDIL